VKLILRQVIGSVLSTFFWASRGTANFLTVGAFSWLDQTGTPPGATSTAGPVFPTSTGEAETVRPVSTLYRQDDPLRKRFVEY
jgi:hypothetical protein